jgi:chromosome segregation ATPase
LNYRHVDIRQSPGIEAIIARIEADLKALDRQIRDETSVTQETSPNHDATLDITLIQLSEAILGLSDKVGRLTDNQEQIAAHTVNLGTLKNSVAAISAATLDQVGRQIAGIDTRFGTLDQGLTRLSEQMNAIHAQLAEPTPRSEPNRPQDSHVASEELKSHIASLQDRMSKSGQQNFAAMSAVLAGTERILERVSRVEDSVKAELKRHEFVSQPSRLKPSSPSETGNALDPRAVIKAARAAVARAREEAGLELDASQQKIGPKSFADPLGA